MYIPKYRVNSGGYAIVSPGEGIEGIAMENLLKMLSLVPQVEFASLRMDNRALMDLIMYVNDSGKARILSKRRKTNLKDAAVPLVAVISLTDLALLLAVKQTPELLESAQRVQLIGV